MKRLTAEQVSKVIDACITTRDKAMLAVVYQCGLRRSEVGILSRSHYSPSDGTLLITRPKKHVQHRVQLWTRTKKLLDEYLETRTDYREFLFLSRKPTYPFSPQGVYYVYQKAARVAGLPIELQHPHCLRHTIASHLAEAGLDLTSIQAHLGHVNPEGTVLYMRGAIDPTLHNMKLAESAWNVARY
jgi:integrase